MNETPQAKLDALVKELSKDGCTVIGTLTITKGGTDTQFLSKTVVAEKPAATKPL
jgi:hypothetical protein